MSTPPKTSTAKVDRLENDGNSAPTSAQIAKAGTMTSGRDQAGAWGATVPSATRPSGTAGSGVGSVISPGLRPRSQCRADRVDHLGQRPVPGEPRRQPVPTA